MMIAQQVAGESTGKRLRVSRGTKGSGLAFCHCVLLKRLEQEQQKAIPAPLPLIQTTRI